MMLRKKDCYEDDNTKAF